MKASFLENHPKSSNFVRQSEIIAGFRADFRLYDLKQLEIKV